MIEDHEAMRDMMNDKVDLMRGGSAQEVYHKSGILEMKRRNSDREVLSRTTEPVSRVRSLRTHQQYLAGTITTGTLTRSEEMIVDDQEDCPRLEIGEILMKLEGIPDMMMNDERSLASDQIPIGETLMNLRRVAKSEDEDMWKMIDFDEIRQSAWVHRDEIRTRLKKADFPSEVQDAKNLDAVLQLSRVESLTRLQGADDPERPQEAITMALIVVKSNSLGGTSVNCLPDPSTWILDHGTIQMQGTPE